MTKTQEITKSVELRMPDMLQAMIPGKRYILSQIMQLSRVGLASTRAMLAACITEGSIHTGIYRQRPLYWRPSEEELERKHQSIEDAQQSQVGLKGYDASLRRLQELSMLARPRSASK